VLIFKNMARIKWMNSFEHKASGWLECRGFLCSADKEAKSAQSMSL
jgi:hypothetical protein